MVVPGRRLLSRRRLGRLRLLRLSQSDFRACGVPKKDATVHQTDGRPHDAPTEYSDRFARPLRVHFSLQRSSIRRRSPNASWRSEPKRYRSRSEVQHALDFLERLREPLARLRRLRRRRGKITKGFRRVQGKQKIQTFRNLIIDILGRRRTGSEEFVRRAN